MSITTSSKRYAQAVFQIARERNSLDEWKADLRKIADLVQNAEFASVIENPRLSFDLKAKLTKEILDKISPLALNFSYLLIAKNKFKDASRIAQEFDYLLNEYHGVKHAEVVTAIPMDTRDESELSQRLANIIGSKIEAEFRVDPAILGGFIARVNGSLIDGSVRNKLEMLRTSMVGRSK